MRRPGRRATALGTGAAVVGAGIVVAVLSGSGGGVAVRAAAPAATAMVERRDLVVTDRYDGTLGYGAARGYVTDRAGVVTTVAAVGTTVEVGGALFSVDFEPTLFVAGAVPAYRSLDTTSKDGPDVRQLEEGLVALGHGAGVTVDEHFDSGTAAAVRRWEQALERGSPDGRVELGDIVFAAGPLRVGTVTADVGARVQQGSTVVEATSTDHVVTVDLEPSRSNALEPGTETGVVLPDGSVTSGTVSEIGAPTSSGSDPEVVPGGRSTVTVPVTITLTDPEAAAAFDSGDVEVTFERSREEGALAVPVQALLALVEGGYAVELVGDPNRLVGVEVGTFADGWVGVTGDGIEPGADVVIPG